MLSPNLTPVLGANAYRRVYRFFQRDFNAPNPHARTPHLAHGQPMTPATRRTSPRCEIRCGCDERARNASDEVPTRDGF